MSRNHRLACNILEASCSWHQKGIHDLHTVSWYLLRHRLLPHRMLVFSCQHLPPQGVLRLMHVLSQRTWPQLHFISMTTIRFHDLTWKGKNMQEDNLSRPSTLLSAWNFCMHFYYWCRIWLSRSGGKGVFLIRFKSSQFSPWIDRRSSIWVKVFVSIRTYLSTVREPLNYQFHKVVNILTIT